MKQTDSTLFYHPGTRWPEFWQLAKDEIEKLEEDYAEEHQVYLCDVGAGCFKASEAFDYFMVKSRVILIWDKPEHIFDRLRKRPAGAWRCRSFQEFYTSEYTDGWKHL